MIQNPDVHLLLTISSLELIELIDIGSVIVAINGDDHRQTNRGFGSGDRDGEDCKHYASRLVRLRSETPECDEIQVRRGQHQLDADENKNCVTSTQGGEESDGKKCGGNEDKGLKGGFHFSCPRKHPTLSFCLGSLIDFPPLRERARRYEQP